MKKYKEVKETKQDLREFLSQREKETRGSEVTMDKKVKNKSKKEKVITDVDLIRQVFSTTLVALNNTIGMVLTDNGKYLTENEIKALKLGLSTWHMLPENQTPDFECDDSPGESMNFLKSMQT